MKLKLTLFSLLALFSLIAVSVWASAHQPIGAAIRDLLAQPAGGNNPWFIATLFDAYFGFLWFWLWVCVRERTGLPRLVWLVLILLAGNMAMAAYVLMALWRLPRGADLADFVLNRQPGHR